MWSPRSFTGDAYNNSTLRGFFETCANVSPTAELANRLPDHLFKRSLTSPDEKFSLSRFVYSNRQAGKWTEKKLYLPPPLRTGLKTSSSKASGDIDGVNTTGFAVTDYNDCETDNREVVPYQQTEDWIHDDEIGLGLYQQLIRQTRARDNPVSDKHRRLMLDFQTRRDLIRPENLVLPVSVLAENGTLGLHGKIIHVKSPVNRFKTRLPKYGDMGSRETKSAEATRLHRAKTQPNNLNNDSNDSHEYKYSPSRSKGRLVLQPGPFVMSSPPATPSNGNGGDSNRNVYFIPTSKGLYTTRGEGGRGNASGRSGRSSSVSCVMGSKSGSGFRPTTVPNSFFSKNRRKYNTTTPSYRPESSTASLATNSDISIDLHSSRGPRRPSTSSAAVSGKPPSCPSRVSIATQKHPWEGADQSLQNTTDTTPITADHQQANGDDHHNGDDRSDPCTDSGQDTASTPRQVISLNVFLPREGEGKSRIGDSRKYESP